MTDDEQRPDETAPTPDDAQPVPNVTPPGQLLKSAREEAKLSVEDVARELRMTATKVRYLEADDYDKLHSDTFVRGYLRTYAKLLELDPVALQEAYLAVRRAQGWDESSEDSPIQASIPQPSKPLWRFAILIVVLLVGLWALSVWFLGNRQAPSAEAGLPETYIDTGAQGVATDQTLARPAEGDTLLQPQGDPSTAGQAGQEGVASADLSEQAPSPEVEALASTQASGGEPAYTEPEVLDQLVIEFSDECWVEVVDARGDVLQTNLLQAGRVLHLSGEAPFNVKLGNAEAARLTLNGEPYLFEAPASGRLITLSVGR